ncbi:mitotic-spindle organizing protein 1-like [Ceratitis capitata]|uniref:mitotic-spindle organizing protein 1-like n=1 Tax=Ceratitis capitata TaxID=7213 RepID=UPI000A10EE2E|nr:mitotic-spindle organizing protein 1-like [Ceratitis capitata]
MKEMVLNTSDKKEKESKLLNTGLNSKVLDIIIRLIETGIHPRALSEVVYKMKQTLKASYVNKNMVE